MTSREDYIRAGDELVQQGRWDEYAGLSRRGYQAFPDDPVLAVRYAQTLVDRAPAQAWHVLERAVALAPQDPHVLVRAAMALVHLGGYDRARELVPRVARLLMQRRGESGADALLLIRVQGLLAAEQGDMELAERNLRVAFDASPSGPGYGAELARIYCRQGRFDEARAVVQRSLASGVEDEELVTLDRWLSSLRPGRP